MFEKNYKEQMNKIAPAPSAVDGAISAAMQEQKPRRVLVIRSIAIACLCFAIIFVSVFAAFHIKNSMKNGMKPVFEGNDEPYVQGNVFIPSSRPIYNSGSYKTLFYNLKDYLINNRNQYKLEINGDFMFDAVEDGVVEEQAPELGGGRNENYNEEADVDFSGNNEQVQGVQEADNVKTDGKYIYFFSPKDHILRIFEANNGNPRFLSKLSLDNGVNWYNAGVMMLEGDRIVFITTVEEKVNNESNEPEVSDDVVYEDYIPYTPPKMLTEITFVDVSDRTAPKVEKTSLQTGRYNNSRLTDGVLYTVSRYGLDFYCRDIDEYFYDPEDLEKYVPAVDGEYIAEKNIFFPEDINNSIYTVVSAYDLNGDISSPSSSLCLVGKNGQIYCNQSNLYIASGIVVTQKEVKGNDTLEFSRQCTEIIRISLGDGDLQLSGCGNVPGTIHDQFSMDEKDGYFRIATTGYYFLANEDDISNKSTRASKLFVLDETLTVVGISAEMGVTEEIKSVRFMGNICYVVTFRQTDPLYAIDLSDPKNPTILSELKIDGFSTYMFNYGQNLLLGIGYNADPETGITTGLKLTMFDTSDPKAVDDLSSYIMDFGSGWMSSEAMENHHAVLVAPNKNVIGLPVWEYDGNNGYGKTSLRFFEFDADSNRIVDLANVDISSGTLYGVRSMYINDYAYIVSPESIISVALNDFEVVSTLSFEMN